MGLELEDEVGDVDEKEDNGSPAGDDEKARSATLFDGTSMSILHEGVVDVILDPLGHEVGGRNDERFHGTSKPRTGGISDKPLTNARERHERGSVLCRSNLEITLRVLQSTSQKRTSQHEEQVGENGTEQLRKNDVVSVLRDAHLDDVEVTYRSLNDPQLA